MMKSLAVLPYVLAYLIQEKIVNGTSYQEVLLCLRSHTGFGDGYYGLIGGKIHSNESPIQALAREAYEEVGISIAPKDAALSHAIYFQGETQTCMSFVFTVKNWQGNPFNKEPDKHDHIEWFDINALPSTLLPRHGRIIERVRHAIPYSDEGFNLPL